jgi:hypothetical protein
MSSLWRKPKYQSHKRKTKNEDATLTTAFGGRSFHPSHNLHHINMPALHSEHSSGKKGFHLRIFVGRGVLSWEWSLKALKRHINYMGVLFIILVS